VLGHALQNVSCENPFYDRIIEMALSGAKNTKDIYSPKKSVRRVMTMSTLLILSHRIPMSEWDTLFEANYLVRLHTSILCVPQAKRNPVRKL
jgi:hypothetical protein